MTAPLKRRMDAVVGEVFGLTPAQLWSRNSTQLLVIARGCYVLAAQAAYPMSIGDLARITFRSEGVLRENRRKVERLIEDKHPAVRRALFDIAVALEIDPLELGVRQRMAVAS